MVRLLVTGKTKSCGCGRVRGSEKAMKQLRQIWLNLPRGEMDWMNVYEFHRWALREGYKTNAVMKKHDETKRYSPHNVYWDPKRKPAGRKRQQNNS